MSVQNTAETHTPNRGQQAQLLDERDERVSEKVESLYASEHYAALSSLIYQEFRIVRTVSPRRDCQTRAIQTTVEPLIRRLLKRTGQQKDNYYK